MSKLIYYDMTPSKELKYERKYIRDLQAKLFFNNLLLNF